MTVCGIDHFNITASRELLEQVRAFYCDVIGLVVGDRPPFDSAGYWLYAGDADQQLATNVATTLNHIALACTDRAEMERKLAAFGVRFRTARVPATSVAQLFLKDPAGNGIELSFADEPA
jgi:catechol 2,3-dioxygenase-like lactoylglutathione lyase family enzyme